MIVDKQNDVTLITEASERLKDFPDRLLRSYNTLRRDNLIVDLSSLKKVTLTDLLRFLELSNRHRKQKRSFVLVMPAARHNEVPDELVVVPTLQEAKDIVAIEEMERDMGF